MMDNRDQIRDELLKLINQYGSRKILARKAATTEQYICMLFKKKRHPGLNVLVNILNECGYELRIVQSQPQLVHEGASNV